MNPSGKIITEDPIVRTLRNLLFYREVAGSI